MTKNNKNKSTRFTPLRISIGINIVLSLVIISAISASIWAYSQYNGGTQRAARFAAMHMYDFCQMSEANGDRWVQEDEYINSAAATDELQKHNELSMNLVCNRGGAEVYNEKAANEYFKANGVELFPEASNTEALEDM